MRPGDAGVTFLAVRPYFIVSARRRRRRPIDRPVPTKKETAMTNRRSFIATAGLGLGAVALADVLLGSSKRAVAGPTANFPMTLTNEEWRKRLTPAQYDILREAGTERAFTSPLNDEHRKGVFACAGCDRKLFSSETKFDSGTGWPSFYQPLPQAVGETIDKSFGFERTEVHCGNCGGHLGHVFDDGPRPTGLRYCMNGLALKFTTA
jgi:peptide-methionine (R)-S-oxide reductase